MLFTSFKLARIDKKIISLLRGSKWYKANKDIDGLILSLGSFDKNEAWVKEIQYFIETAWSSNSLKSLFEKYHLSKTDLVDIFLLMTLGTLPNPLFKTGRSKLSYTLVGSSMYQEKTKQLKPFLASLGTLKNQEEEESFGHKYASDAIFFALHLKSVHEIKYGEINLEEVL